MDKKVKNIFFLGKGGVGKSTSSAITALHLAESGHRVLLISMDPAHNQGDIFEKKFSEKSVKINENLSVREINIDFWVKRYITDIRLQIKRTYSYLTAFNLDGYFDVIKYSPGIEEYALLIAYKNIRQAIVDIDYIIFDMPPTALTIKFLTLPDLSLLWLKNLLDLRNKIIEKRKIITKVKLGTKVIEKDKILSKIHEQIAEYKEIKTVFQDSDKTILNLVLNTDKLSFAESQLIMESLSKFNIPLKNIFVNKCNSSYDTKPIEEKYTHCGFQKLPDSKTPLMGIPALTDYLHSIPSFITM